MTAQIPETLVYEGEEMAMYTNPLDDYFALGGVDPGLWSGCTALWRGYVGRWEIVQDRLYLVGLSGTLRSGQEATLATVFPAFPERVFAHWYCGTIRIPRGRRLRYVHMGYRSVFERDVLLDVRRGVVVSRQVRHNGEAAPGEQGGQAPAALGPDGSSRGEDAR